MTKTKSNPLPIGYANTKFTKIWFPQLVICLDNLGVLWSRSHKLCRNSVVFEKAIRGLPAY